MNQTSSISVDTTVGIHPKRIRSISEVEGILSKIVNYEQRVGSNAGVLVMQNKQLGGSYRIESESKAHKIIDQPTKCEWGVTYYSRSYFEELKRSLRD